MKKQLIIPKTAYKITKNHRPLNPNFKVFGCDTETANGIPFLLQINNEKDNIKMFNVSAENIFDTFLKYIESQITQYEIAICFFHNLSFDLVALLKGIDETLFKKSEFEIKRQGWRCQFFCSKTWFARMRKNHKQIIILDSKAFLPYSLEKVANDLKIEFKKLPKPEGLGDKILTTPEFYEYAKQDVLIQQRVGEWIMKLHKEFDTRVSVSLPHLSSLIFRHFFLQPDDIIELPPQKIVKASLSSYHGGKNGFYIKGGFYKDVAEIDLNSAYPYAMKCLPSFLKGEYKEVDKYVKDYVGIYCISGKSNCPYNITFNDEFKPVKEFEKIWITSYELEQALKYDEIKIDNIFGYIWIPKSERNPFGDYVDYFYKLKNETPKTNALYTFYKLLLNSLYGKLIQMTEINDDESEKTDFITYLNKKGEMIVKRVKKRYRAGGLFNPFIATLITGKTRAMIHELEHKFKAIHTATDSIKTFEKITGESKELGGYKLEVRGDCLLFRNKMYLHFNEKNELVKYATHGYQGSILSLVDLYLHKSNTYKHKKMIRVKEALIQKKTSLKMELLTRELDLDWNNFNYKKFETDKYFYKGKSFTELLKEQNFGV